MPQALQQLRIVDFSRVLAGPLATMVLADLGAEVIKVERPGLGDDTRAWGPPWDDTGTATYFHAVNRNKTSVALDLGNPEDLQRARRLVADADVLVENFRPGVMEKFGLGFDQVRRGNAAIVYCSITGFGAGKGASLPGYDLLVQALGGLMSITGSPEEPQKVGVALVDVICGLFASIGILASLRHRERTGEGQRVEVDLLSSLLAALVNQGSAYTIAGVVGQRLGSAHPSIAPYQVLHTGEGDLVVAVGTDGQFRALCEVLGCAELADEADFATNGARVANRVRLCSLLEAMLLKGTAAEWVRALSRARVPAGELNDIQGAFALAEELELEPIVEVPGKDGAVTRLTRNPIRLSATPVVYRSAPPTLSDDDGESPAR
jgi:crotonobetainyl-CoA:carnitine CoA-transferase CaiB-like acyl-CoA transferase